MSKFSNHNFKGEKVLVRVDFNVPLDENFNITDDTRMTATIPTIKKILADGGKVILMSHFGRPKGGPEDKYSLKHLVKHLYQLLNADNGPQTTTNDQRFLRRRLHWRAGKTHCKYAAPRRSFIIGEPSFL